MWKRHHRGRNEREIAAEMLEQRWKEKENERQNAD